MEGVSPPGSHKPNTAAAQAYFAAKQGIKRLTTETGAGQWGSALAFATKLVGLEGMIYMVRVSYYQKPYRRIMMETWGAHVVPSPSDRTDIGRKFLEQDPNHPGSLGISISEAIWDALQRDDTRYSLGSVLNHVILHQSIVGLEAKMEMELLDDYPDVVTGCVGGGSNYSGFMVPFYYDVASKKAPKPVRFVAVEPTSCPTLTKGVYSYDYGDMGKLTPLIPMYTLGYNFIPPPIHAGGLRYHGDAPMLCLLRKEGQLEAAAYDQVSVFKAARLFAQVEGFIVAPETAHVVKHVIEEALDAKRKNEERVIIFNNSGHGLMDLAAYDAFLQEKLKPYYYEEEKIRQSLEQLRKEMPWLDEINKKYLGA